MEAPEKTVDEGKSPLYSGRNISGSRLGFALDKAGGSVFKSASDDIFGEYSSSASSGDEAEAKKGMHDDVAMESEGEEEVGKKERATHRVLDSDDDDMDGRERDEEEEGEAEEQRVEAPTYIDLHLTKVRADLGPEGPMFVRFPNFLGVETKPLDPETYEEEVEEEDEEGKMRLKLKVGE
jgi:RNA polymerase-associated protein LEO1